jgi:hypothetical protein
LNVDHSDDSFLHALETGAIPNHAFHHRDHLRAAWLYVRRRGMADAERAMLETIQRFASLHGHASKFHHTLTVLWVKLVAAHATHHVEATFDELLKLDARLLDKDLPLSFYSRGVLFSERARSRWVEPDVRTLPSTG